MTIRGWSTSRAFGGTRKLAVWLLIQMLQSAATFRIYFGYFKAKCFRVLLKM